MMWNRLMMWTGNAYAKWRFEEEYYGPPPIEGVIVLAPKLPPVWRGRNRLMGYLWPRRARFQPVDDTAATVRLLLLTGVGT